MICLMFHVVTIPICPIYVGIPLYYAMLLCLHYATIPLIMLSCLYIMPNYIFNILPYSMSHVILPYLMMYHFVPKLYTLSRFCFIPYFSFQHAILPCTLVRCLCLIHCYHALLILEIACCVQSVVINVMGSWVTNVYACMLSLGSKNE